MSGDRVEPAAAFTCAVVRHRPNLLPLDLSERVWSAIIYPMERERDSRAPAWSVLSRAQTVLGVVLRHNVAVYSQRWGYARPSGAAAALGTVRNQIARKTREFHRAMAGV